MFIFAAFRVNFGYDYEAYKEIFEYIHNFPGRYNDLREEVGYVMINEWLPTFRSLIILTSAFTCAAYIFFFYKVIPAKFAWLAILLLFLAGDKAIFFMFSGIRNAISISILILSLPLLQNKKLLPFVLCMLLASAFHKTAFIYFPLSYLVCNNKDMTRREIMIWVGVFSFFILFSHTAIMDSFENLISMGFDDRYDIYLDKINEIGDNQGFLIQITGLLMFIPLLLYAYHGSFTTQENIVLRLGLVYIVSESISVLNLRTTQHFILFFIASVVLFFSQYKRNMTIKNMYLLFVIAYLAYALFVVYIGNPTFPYDVYESTIFGTIE